MHTPSRVCGSARCSYVVSSRLSGRPFGSWWREGGVDLAGDVALQAANDLSLAEAFGGATFHVGACRLLVAHADCWRSTSVAFCDQRESRWLIPSSSSGADPNGASCRAGRPRPRSGLGAPAAAPGEFTYRHLGECLDVALAKPRHLRVRDHSGVELRPPDAAQSRTRLSHSASPEPPAS